MQDKLSKKRRIFLLSKRFLENNKAPEDPYQRA